MKERRKERRRKKSRKAWRGKKTLFKLESFYEVPYLLVSQVRLSH